uniref:Uncharacterized protein n=1 Tax=Glossina brevipalpis TaxID=37001 RepID=A0A1A9WZA7_9MUSC
MLFTFTEGEEYEDKLTNQNQKNGINFVSNAVRVFLYLQPKEISYIGDVYTSVTTSLEQQQKSLCHTEGCESTDKDIKPAPENSMDIESLPKVAMAQEFLDLNPYFSKRRAHASVNIILHPLDPFWDTGFASLFNVANNLLEDCDNRATEADRTDDHTETKAVGFGSPCADYADGSLGGGETAHAAFLLLPLLLVKHIFIKRLMTYHFDNQLPPLASIGAIVATMVLDSIGALVARAHRKLKGKDIFVIKINIETYFHKKINDLPFSLL